MKVTVEMVNNGYVVKYTPDIYSMSFKHVGEDACFIYEGFGEVVNKLREVFGITVEQGPAQTPEGSER